MKKLRPYFARKTNGSGRKYLPEDRPVITPRMAEILHFTWKILQKNIEHVGVLTFIRLFETHPDVQEMFLPFKGLSQEDLRYSLELKAHALRVMGTVEKVLARLDKPQRLEEILVDLAQRHRNLDIKVEFLDLMGPQFIYAIQPTLETYWTMEIQDAWLQLFAFIGHVLKENMFSK